MYLDPYQEAAGAVRWRVGFPPSSRPRPRPLPTLISSCQPPTHILSAAVWLRGAYLFLARRTVVL